MTITKQTTDGWVAESPTEDPNVSIKSFPQPTEAEAIAKVEAAVAMRAARRAS